MCKRFFCILLILTVLLCGATMPLCASAQLFNPDFTLTAEHVLVINLNTGTEVYSLNADESLFPASTTKIMTAILTIENCENTDVMVTATKSALSNVELSSSVAGIVEGEILSVKDLLGMLLVRSGSDAAYVLAEYIGGSVSNFINMMNDRATELKCTGTSFVNPTGMHNAEHYSTARDMGIIACHALTLPLFAELFGMKEYTTADTNMSDAHFYTTTNFLIDLNRGGSSYYKYATGGKTGFTTPAGRCLISTAQKGDTQYLSLVFGCRTDSGSSETLAFTDTVKIFDWCFDSLKLQKIASLDVPIDEVSLKYAWNHDYVTLSPTADMYAVLPDDKTVDDLTKTTTVPESLDAPVKKGDYAGTVTYSYDGVVLSTGKLEVYESVDRNLLVYIIAKVSEFFKSTAALILLGVVLILLAVYLFIRVAIRSKARSSYKRRKRYRRYKRY